MADCNCTFPVTCSNGCPVDLDFTCVFYHKDNNEVTELDGLGLTNGATLELVIETIDEKIKQMDFSLVTLPYLKAGNTVNNLTQFAQAVDTEFAALAADVATALAASSQALTATDSATVDFTTSGTLNHTLTASVKLSANAGNRVTAEADGLHVAGQTVSINYTTKELSISGGNTVSFASLVGGTVGWLGNLASDPTAVDGQYWYNTTSDLLKIKVNGVVKTITTS